jgi:hypothetical protein
MNIRRISYALWVLPLLAACAEPRATEPAAPASSPDKTSFATAPAAEPAPAPATPAPAAAPAPQGLDQARSTESSSKDEEFSNLEAAERALNQAKSDLDRLALAEAPVQVGRAAPTDGAPKAEKKGKATHANAGAGAAAASAAPNALCDNACRAFASLSRAANAVCRLDGDSGSHCSRAKRVVADSQQRVASCACQNGD